MQRSYTSAGFYIYDTKTNLYLGSDLTWSSRGARIPSLDDVKKRLRILAENIETASRPDHWETVPHEYVQATVSSYLPSTVVITNEYKEPIASSKAYTLYILAWSPALGRKI